MSVLGAVPTARSIPWIASLALVLVFGPGRAETGKAIGVPLDLGRDRARIRVFVARLDDPRPAVWREAQIRLAVAGPMALDELEASGVLRSHPTRVKQLLSLALLTTVTESDLDAHAELHRLVSAEIGKGFAVAEMLANARFFGIEGREPPGCAKADSLGGFFVPAAVHMCDDRRPVARAYAARLLIPAPITAKQLQELIGDSTEIRYARSDVASNTTVADVAGAALALQGRGMGIGSVVEKMEWLNGPRSLYVELTSLILQASHTKEATTWDEWWDAIRPAWAHWWTLAREGQYPPHWANGGSLSSGFQLQRQKAVSGRRELRVRGPRGTACDVFDEAGVLLKSGQVPLDFVWPGKSDRLAESAEAVVGVRVRATFPDGRVWEESFVDNLRQVWTLSLSGSWQGDR